VAVAVVMAVEEASVMAEMVVKVAKVAIHTGGLHAPNRSRQKEQQLSCARFAQDDSGASGG
jgi:hypothetical protein